MRYHKVLVYCQVLRRGEAQAIKNKNTPSTGRRDHER